MNNTSSSDGRVIVITGTTGALGRKVAQAFAARGHSLVLLDRNQDRLYALTQELNLPPERVFATVIDLQDGEALRTAAEAVSVSAEPNPRPQRLWGGVGERPVADGDETNCD
ncbi:MAG TPA: SDR family NAD(P)-dependent oxidoreductase [Anaerolineales bacterium]|nr:SDR family NAD(P)-dependent oxidoreductase [Anaerolineales bacterium]